jgi:hypothetical protein
MQHEKQGRHKAKSEWIKVLLNIARHGATHL